jgi:dynactin-6
VHPRAKLNSSYAPIKIGSNCIISERSSVGLQSATSEDQSEGVVIENGVIIEAGASVEARTIREGSVVEINARVGKGAVIGKV